MFLIITVRSIINMYPNFRDCKVEELSIRINDHLLVFRASLVAQLVKNPPAMWETPVWFLGQEDPLEKGWATHSSILGLPWWQRICLQCRRPGFDRRVGKIPWRREWPPTPVFWPGESHGFYRECHGLYSPWVTKRHNWVTFIFRRVITKLVKSSLFLPRK